MTIQNDKTTAHQLWCNQVQESLIAIIYPKRIEKGKSAFMTSRAEIKRVLDESLSAVVTFENTRLRVVSDEMISRLDSAKKSVASLESEFKRTHPFRFMKLRRLRTDHSKAKAIQEAYQSAVLVLVNTPPPFETPNVKPEMKVSK